MFAACDSFKARFLLFRAGWVGYLHSKTLVVFVDCYLPPPILLNIYKHKKFDIHILLLAPPFSVFFMIDHLCNFPHLSSHPYHHCPLILSTSSSAKHLPEPTHIVETTIPTTIRHQRHAKGAQKITPIDGMNPHIHTTMTCGNSNNNNQERHRT